MSNLPVLKFRALDNNGTVLPGATLDFFEYTGTPTTTPQGTWSDLARTVPNTNPAVADGAGYFPEIYLDPALAYYIVLKDADGVLIDDYEEIYATSLGSSSLITRIQGAGVSPTDFGAIGDGVADESGKVQDALDAATRIVDLCGYIYRCNHSLSIASNDIEIVNGYLDFSNCPDDEYIKCEGELGNSIAIATNVTAGDVVINISNPVGLSVGDVLMLSSSGTWRGGTGNTGELMTVVAITPGAEGNITIASPARDNYTAVSSSLKVITPVEGVALRGVTIYGSTSASGDGVLFFADLCERLRFENCLFEGIKSAGLRLNTCLDVNVANCAFKDGAVASIGIEVAECCEQVIVDDCTFERLAYEVDIGAVGARDGVCRGITVSCARLVGPTINGIIVRELAQNVTLLANESEGCAVVPVRLVSASGVKLIGNKSRTSAARALHATGIVDNVLLSSNILERIGTDGPVVEFAGTAAGNISYCAAVGNRIIGGTYGIAGSNVLSGTFARGPNLFSGQATAETTGLGTNVAIDCGALTASGDLTISGLTADRAVVTTTAGKLAVAAGLPATLNGSSLVVQDPANATATPTATKIPISGGDNKLAAGWLPDLSGTYATAAKGVTNGDSHDHSGGDGGQIAHTALSAIGTNAHSAIDSHIGSTSNPHSVTAAQVGAVATGDPVTTATANTIVKRDADADIWISDLHAEIINSSAYVLATQYIRTAIFWPYSQASAPDPAEGMIYYNSSTKHFYGYNGTSWLQLS